MIQVKIARTNLGGKTVLAANRVDNDLLVMGLAVEVQGNAMDWARRGVDSADRQRMQQAIDKEWPNEYEVVTT